MASIIKLTVKQYQDAITNTLNSKQIEVLQALYYFPNSTANAIDLAKALNYSHHVVASKEIGNIGKAIANYLDLKLEDYFYPYKLIGPYSPQEGGIRGNDRGWEMVGNLRTALENEGLIDAIPDNELQEGTPYKIIQTRYERDPNARKDCLTYYGYACTVCGFNFEQEYGEIGKEFIHVHHLVPLSQTKESYTINPIKDLRPVCPNCHAMLHRQTPPLGIEELSKNIKANR